MSDSGIHGLPIHHGGGVGVSDAPPVHASPTPLVQAGDLVVSDDLFSPDGLDDDPVSVVHAGPTVGDVAPVGVRTADAGRRLGPVVINARMSTVLLAAIWIALLVLYMLVRPGG